eukprot:5924557-Alexandrium_andersonii.AAC.1
MRSVPDLRRRVGPSARRSPLCVPSAVAAAGVRPQYHPLSWCVVSLALEHPRARAPCGPRAAATPNRKAAG